MKSMKPYYKYCEMHWPQARGSITYEKLKMNRKFKKWNIKEVNLTMY